MSTLNNTNVCTKHFFVSNTFMQFKFMTSFHVISLHLDNLPLSRESIADFIFSCP